MLGRVVCQFVKQQCEVASLASRQQHPLSIELDAVGLCSQVRREAILDNPGKFCSLDVTGKMREVIT